MTVTEILTTEDASRWRALVPAARNVFGSVEFARIAERNAATPARLFVWRDGDAVAVYPYFLHERDTSTPEFTGPIAVDVPEQWSERALQEAFHEHAVATGIVAEFAHLDPFRPHAAHSEFEHFNREIVWIDLTRTPEQMWSEDFSHACRKNINRARKENVTVRRAESHDDVREFHRIYLGTMDRNAAQARYYFPLEYFLAFFDELPGQSIFLLAEHQGNVIAATLYLADDTNVFSYLGGADHACQALRPTNLVVQRMIELGRERGCRRLILGGGYRPDDGIFRFKASFSPLRGRFNVYRRVHLQGEYDRLVAEWSSRHGVAPPTDFFPAYRAKLPRSGGRMTKIHMSSPDITEKEINAVNAVMATRRNLSMGEQVEDFERLIVEQVTHAGRAVAVSSGTAGLHLGVIAAGAGPGDAVITSPFSFVASANAIWYERAMPVLLDVEESTGNIDPALIAECVDDLMNRRPAAKRWLPPSKRNEDLPRLKALLPVDVFGQPADYDRINPVAQRWALPVIEDSCEAIGAEYNGRPAGMLGDCGVFAFYPNKQMTTGEGGVLVTRRDDWADLFVSLRNQGRDKHDKWLDHSRLGYNYRMDELSAAVGVAQLQRFKELSRKRAQVAAWYNQRLANAELIEIPKIAATTTTMSWFVYVVRIQPPASRDVVMERLESEGIPSRPYFTPIHVQRFYRDTFGYKVGDFPITEKLGDISLALPFSGVMNEEQVDLVCEKLVAAVQATAVVA